MTQPDPRDVTAANDILLTAFSVVRAAGIPTTAAPVTRPLADVGDIVHRLHQERGNSGLLLLVLTLAGMVANYVAAEARATGQTFGEVLDRYNLEALTGHTGQPPTT